MKGNEKIIAILNEFLSDELTAINQYMVHSEMCDNWGYQKLHKHFEKRAVEEMKHAERAAERLHLLGGTPTTRVTPIVVGASLDEMIALDVKAEQEAIALYRDAVEFFAAEKEYVTEDLFRSFLADEEEHLDYFQKLGE